MTKFFIQVHTPEPIMFAAMCDNEDQAVAIAKAIAAANEHAQWDVEAE